MDYIKELDNGCYTDEEKKMYEELRSNGMEAVGAREALDSFNSEELRGIVRFLKFYQHYLVHEEA